MHKLIFGGMVVAVAVCVGSPALGAEGPPAPKAPGKAVTLVASGVPTPIQFAFSGAETYVAAGGGEGKGAPKGGVFVLRAHKAVRLAHSPAFVAGVAWSRGTLYVSGGNRLLAWSGWNGKAFTQTRTIVSMKGKFTGFSGLAIGPGGQIFTGVQLGSAKKDDYRAGKTPYANDILRVDPRSGKIAIVATGLRQPWQLLFPQGARAPVVSDLGQDNLGAKKPRDYIVTATTGAHFGFPTCNWDKPAACKRFAKPLAFFPAHASPMGLASTGSTLYVALFGGAGKGPEVVSLPASGGKFTPFATGYKAPVLAVGTFRGTVYTGDLTGAIYQIK